MFKPIATLRKSRRDPSRSFLRDKSGAMAVEFAMVALPLIFMLLSIMELALVFMVSSTLENATNEVSRKIRTGALQTSGTATATTFRNAVCSELGWLQAQCQSNLVIDVRPSSFAQSAPPVTTDGTTNTPFNPSKALFNMGTAQDIILVRSFYQWKLISPFLAFSGMPSYNGGRLITATTTFRNEPYS